MWATLDKTVPLFIPKYGHTDCGLINCTAKDVEIVTFYVDYLLFFHYFKLHFKGAVLD